MIYIEIYGGTVRKMSEKTYVEYLKHKILTGEVNVTKVFGTKVLDNLRSPEQWDTETLRGELRRMQAYVNKKREIPNENLA